MNDLLKSLLTTLLVCSVVGFILIPLISAQEVFSCDKTVFLGALILGVVIFICCEIIGLKRNSFDMYSFGSFLSDNVFTFLLSIMLAFWIVLWIGVIYNIRYVLEAFGNLFSDLKEFSLIFRWETWHSIFSWLWSYVITNWVVYVVVGSIATVLGIKYYLYKKFRMRRWTKN